MKRVLKEKAQRNSQEKKERLMKRFLKERTLVIQIYIYLNDYYFILSHRQ